MKRALVLMSLLAFSAHAADPVPADAPKLDTVKLDSVKLGEDPQTDLNVARYVVFLEDKNAQLEKAHIPPVALVLIAVGGALVGAGVTIGIYEAGKPKPRP